MLYCAHLIHRWTFLWNDFQKVLQD